MLPCLADCPADNQPRQLALFLYGTLAVIMESPKFNFLNKRHMLSSYYDDLSYNHENNSVIYYKEVIKEVQKMGIDYYNYNEILNINQND